jgi:hypothetical protein
VPPAPVQDLWMLTRTRKQFVTYGTDHHYLGRCHSPA